jgi:hypothetical protein
VSVSQLTLYFFLPESRAVLEFARYVVLMAKRDAFKAHVHMLVEKRFSSWCLIIPLRWIYALGFCPLNKSDSLSRSHYEKVVLLPTFKPQQLTAADSQTSASYYY